MHYEQVHCTTRPVQRQAAPCAFVPRVHATAYLDGVQGHEFHVSVHALRAGASSGLLHLTENFRRNAGNILSVMHRYHPD